MHDGSIVFSTALDNKEFERQYQQTIKKIDSLNQKIYMKQREKMPLVDQAKQLGAELDLAKAKLFELQNAPKSSVSSEQLKEQRAYVSGLQAEWNKINNRVDACDQSIQRSKLSIEVESEKAGELAKYLADAGDSGERMDKAVKKANSSMSDFAKRVRSVVRSALVFTVITQALAKFRTWIGKVIQSNNDASSAISKLKAALLTMVQPLVGVIIPAFTKLVGILTKVITAISRVIAALFGMTYEQAQEAAESLNEETNAMEGLGGAAQKAEKQLASFDEINKLAAASLGGGGSSSGATAPDFSGLNKLGLPEWLENLITDLELKIQDLRFSWDSGTIYKNSDAWIVFLSGLLGAVIGSMFGGLSGGVIGLLLGVAIGLISCTFLDKTDNPTKNKRLFTLVLASILGAVIGARFGGLTGAIIGLSLGLMVGLIAVEFQKGTFSNWDAGDTWNTVLNAILFAVIGFAFGNVVGGVIGLAFGLAISIIEVSFFKDLSDEEGDKIKWRTVFGAILGAILGAIFSGLLAVSGPVGAAIGIVVGLSVAFASIQFDPNISDEAKSAAQKVFTVALTAILGAILGAMFGSVFGAVVGLTLGLAIGWAKVTYEKIPAHFGGGFNSGTGAGGGFGGGGGGFGGLSAYSIRAASIPALAKGAVIPPNREFMAVLGDQKSGTNIEAPLDTIVQAVMLALSKSGYSGGNGENVAYLYVGDDQFGKLVYKANRRESNRIGVTLVEGSV